MWWQLLYLQDQHCDLPALLLSEMTGDTGKQVASARENLLGLVIPAKPCAPDKRLLANNRLNNPGSVIH